MSALTHAIDYMYCGCHRRPILIIAVMVILCGLAAYEVRSFRFDASADTMISQADPELAFYKEVTDTFSESPFLVLTYTPLQGELFTPYHIDRLTELTDALLIVEGVSGVGSLLDAPLLHPYRAFQASLAGIVLTGAIVSNRKAHGWLVVLFIAVFLASQLVVRMNLGALIAN